MRNFLGEGEFFFVGKKGIIVVEGVGDFFRFSFGKLRGIVCVCFCLWCRGWGLFLKMQIKI
jgi:hypothetical protein